MVHLWTRRKRNIKIFPPLLVKSDPLFIVKFLKIFVKTSKMIKWSEIKRFYNMKKRVSGFGRNKTENAVSASKTTRKLTKLT